MTSLGNVAKKHVCVFYGTLASTVEFLSNFAQEAVTK